MSHRICKRQMHNYNSSDPPSSGACTEAICGRYLVQKGLCNCSGTVHLLACPGNSCLQVTHLVLAAGLYRGMCPMLVTFAVGSGAWTLQGKNKEH